MNMLKMKYAVLLLILLPAMILWERCSFHDTRDTTFLPIPYPHPLPDSIAKIFLPGIVSNDGLDFNACFSPDGKTFYFSRSRNGKYIIMECRYDGNKWSGAKSSPLFDTSFSNTDPFIATDGSLYFISNRPRNNTDTLDDYDIYRMSQRGDSYLAPEEITSVNSDSTEYYVSVSASGNIYFASYREGQLDLFVSKRKDKGYEIPVNLGPVINSASNEHDPLVAADESFLVFNSDRPGGFGEADLYISHYRDGAWQMPVNMGSRINTGTYEYCPYLTPDGKYFFYSSEQEVKWISSSILRK
jgi:Tol biopolymer transport system component